LKILNFNISKFKYDIISNNLNFKEFNDILFKNNVDEFLEFINIKISTDKYIDCWFKIIFSNVKKLLKKQDKIIKEVIEDINKLNNYSTEYPVDEKNILNYDRYLIENLKNKK
jgi:hypothetical protein